MSSFADSSRKENEKRTDYISWEDYFMATALLAAKRSKDPSTQVGACIVNNDNIVIGVGYNGFPKGCSDDEFPWGKNAAQKLDNKHFYVCHAEVNAIMNKNNMDAKDCKMYVTLFPCNECAKFIIQSGIKEIFFMRYKHNKQLETAAAKRMFDSAKVKYSQFYTKLKKITIDFDDNNRNAEMQPSSPSSSS